MEYKHSPIRLKDIDAKKGIVISYPSTFNVLDDGGDIVDPGAFKRTINAWGPEGKRRIKALYMHEPAWMVGKPLVMREDDVGLYVETQITKTRMAMDVMTLLEDEIITEESIGYDIVQKKMDNDVRHLVELKLYEYSYVAWGMNEYTPIIGVKSATQADRLIQSMERMEKALRNSHFETEEIPQMLELAVKRWRDEVKALKQEREQEQTDKPIEITTDAKANSFEENLQQQDFWQGFYRMMSTLRDTIFGIIEDPDETDRAGKIEESVGQFLAAIVALIKRGEDDGVFDEKGRQKAMEMKALLRKLNPADATSAEEDSHTGTGDSGDHSPDADEGDDDASALLESVKSLGRMAQEKVLLKEFRDFGRSLKKE